MKGSLNDENAKQRGMYIEKKEQKNMINHMNVGKGAEPLKTEFETLILSSDVGYALDSVVMCKSTRTVSHKSIPAIPHKSTHAVSHTSICVVTCKSTHEVEHKSASAATCKGTHVVIGKESLCSNI